MRYTKAAAAEIFSLPMNLMDPWDALALSYERFRLCADSFDALMDWPAQQSAVREVTGQAVLDLGCGSGWKAAHFARTGAARVVGIDVSTSYRDLWSQAAELAPQLEFHVGDLNSLDEIDALKGRTFDVVVCFQAMGYSRNIPGRFA
jgi:SAM-dependent methyltransferase